MKILLLALLSVQKQLICAWGGVQYCASYLISLKFYATCLDSIHWAIILAFLPRGLHVLTSPTCRAWFRKHVILFGATLLFVAFGSESTLSSMEPPPSGITFNNAHLATDPLKIPPNVETSAWRTTRSLPAWICLLLVLVIRVLVHSNAFLFVPSCLLCFITATYRAGENSDCIRIHSDYSVSCNSIWLNSVSI